MSASKKCQECGTELPENAPEGLCPKCLMRVVMGESRVGVTLNNPADPPRRGGDTIPAKAGIDGPGTTIGRYELLELIGEGGMALVYLAEQKEPVRRKVALKIIKPGMDSRQVVARFEAERQTLALLDHPNIAHVFDAGCTETGRPYFVMEHVKSMPITRYCDENKLTIEQRLRLFEQVCEAVHHAHQKGIIHRDLKPSNILVSVHGDRPVPKIIDFGIAKAITAPLTDKTAVTLQGQLLGTPEYMSPEQVDLAMQDIDTRSDIYSLGVVLYELLAGVLPFEEDSFARAGLAAIQQTIREQEPALPSLRLTSLGEKAKTIAASRGTQVIPLARRLHRELEWIPLKAMRKDRCRRYRSASEMADDLRNYLNGLPLLAGPETTVYRVQKFVRKHAGSATAVALVALAVILGFGTSTTMYVKAEDARQEEASARETAEQARLRAEQAEKAAQAQVEAYRRELYVNRITLAERAYREADISLVQKLLERCPADLRGWEWYRLSHASNRQPALRFSGHNGTVYSASITPDGRHLVSTSADKTIKIWDAATGTELRTLRGHKERVHSVSSSPNGDRIVSGGCDGIIKIWDASAGSELMSIPAHDHWIWSVSFSPDGKTIASGSFDETVKLWNAETGAVIATLRGHVGMVGLVTFSPDGKHIASGSEDKTVKLWDAEDGAEVMTFRGHERFVTSLTFSHDGKQILSGGCDGTLRVWNVLTGEQSMVIHGHEPGRDRVMSVSFSPDGRSIVSCSKGAIKTWDARTGRELMTLKPANGAFSAKFTPDGTRILSTGENVVEEWDVTATSEMKTLRGHTDVVSCVTFGPDGRSLASASHDKTIRLWDLADSSKVTILRGHESAVRTVSYRPDGRQVASASRSGELKVWDCTTGREISAAKAHDGEINSISYSPDGTRIATISVADRTVRVWNPTSCERLMTLEGLDNFGYSVRFSPDGKYIAAGAEEGMVKIWNADSGIDVATLGRRPGEEYCSVYGITFSPDGRRIAAAGEISKVWDLETGKELMKLGTYGDYAWSVVFTPDGKRIIGGAGNLKVWDASNGSEIVTFGEYAQSIGSVSISTDGRLIAAGGSDDSLIRIWESAGPGDTMPKGKRQNEYGTAWAEAHPTSWRLSERGDHAVDAEDFGDAPGLGRAAGGTVRRVAVEDLGDAAETGIFDQMTQQRTQKLGYVTLAFRAVAADLHIGFEKGTHQKRPDRALVIGFIPAPGRAFVPPFVRRIATAQRARSVGRQQSLLDGVHDRPLDRAS